MCVQVIEVLVRSEQGLFREVVKHLNQVEEQVLESLAWTSDSPLWESLRGAKDQVPACQQVQNTQQTGQHSSLTRIKDTYSCHRVKLLISLLLDIIILDIFIVL